LKNSEMTKSARDLERLVYKKKKCNQS